MRVIDLSVCVPTLRGTDRVTRLLASVESFTPLGMAWEAIVVDCGSELRGYTEPQNQAMAAGKGRYLLCVNDDVELAAGWWEPMVAELEAGAWCVTPDMTHSDGPQIYAPYCALWTREAWLEIGGLDEQFRHWCSDIDMARRLVDAGHTPAKVKLPNPITHQANGTAEEKPDIAGPVWAMCHGDLERFARKWGVSAETEKYRLRDLVWSPS